MAGPGLEQAGQVEQDLDLDLARRVGGGQTLHHELTEPGVVVGEARLTVHHRGLDGAVEPGIEHRSLVGGHGAAPRDEGHRNQLVVHVRSALGGDPGVKRCLSFITSA